MNLSTRDLKILSFINECGFCVMPQIQKQFSLKFPRSYQVMQRLIKEGVVQHNQIFRYKHGIYYLTKKGATFSELPALSNIALGGYKHQLMITDIRQKLCDQYPDSKWVSERQLKQQKFHYGIGRLGHVADGILILADNKQVAIEIELSLKGKFRLDKIFRAYASQTTIREAWYFCADSIIPAFTKLAGKKPFIKIFAIKEFLYE